MAETFGWGANDRILLDRFAYATMDAGLRRLALAHGVDIVEVGSLPDGTIDLEALDDLVDDRVRLVLVTHMPTHVGTLTDAAEVGQVLSGSGAIYALDISQTVGQMAVDVQALGCDVAFAPARKFLRAPPRARRSCTCVNRSPTGSFHSRPRSAPRSTRAPVTSSSPPACVASTSTRVASRRVSVWASRLAYAMQIGLDVIAEPSSSAASRSPTC